MILLYWNSDSDRLSGTELFAVIGFITVLYGAYWLYCKSKQ
jgi:hypothetical protein